MKKVNLLFNSEPRLVFCVDTTEALDGLNDTGHINLIPGIFYHLDAVKKVVENDKIYLEVALKELEDAFFNVNRFVEVEYEKRFGDFDIRNPRMRHIACVNNDDFIFGCKDNASKYLKRGKIYHVLEVHIDIQGIYVLLHEFPNLEFNAGHFSEIVPVVNEC
ncbi:MAG: hypothetical protein PHH22_00235 [Clostridia bacterium]|nr:hypothetical protein [Clostridia bacterium]